MASLSASEVERSVLAADTARMMELGLAMYLMHMSLTWASMSSGWSPTGTLVIPGRSTRVKVRTRGEKILRWIGSGQMPYGARMF